MRWNDRKSATRVVVTGLGVVSPIGLGTENFWHAVLAGEVGTAEITQFDTSRFLTHRGGEVKDFKPGAYIKSGKYSELSRSAVCSRGRRDGPGGRRIASSMLGLGPYWRLLRHGNRQPA